MKITLKTEHPPKREALRLHMYEDPPENYQQERRHHKDYGCSRSKKSIIATRRLVLSILAARAFLCEQLDVKTTFLHGDLDKDIYMTQSEGFQSAGKEENLVCKLKKSLYGLKQAPRQWYLKFDSFMQRAGYKRCAMDHLFEMKDRCSEKQVLGYVLTVGVTTVEWESRLQKSITIYTKSSKQLAKNLKVCSWAKLVRILISEGSLSLLKILGTKSLAEMYTRLVMKEKLKFCAASTGLRVN
ncbi:retrovirus-related pol polyprotein from transposon TNT 1-94 [Tanacetum coccineum]